MKTTPAVLLCRAIMNKIPCFCGDRPDVYIFIPSEFMQKDVSGDYRDFALGMKIYIELKSAMSGPAYETVYNRYMFFVDIKNITDHTNIICESSCVYKIGNRGDEYHAYTNLSVSFSQVRNFIKEFICYSHFGDMSLKTIGRNESCKMTTNSLLTPPDSSTFWRWVALARI